MPPKVEQQNPASRQNPLNLVAQAQGKNQAQTLPPNNQNKQPLQQLKQPPQISNQKNTIQQEVIKTNQKIVYDLKYVQSRLKNMFEMSTDEEPVKDYAKSLFLKLNSQHTEFLKSEQNLMPNTIQKRDIQPKLQKWRLKERKIEFVEKIHALTIKELLPKAQIQKKLQILDEFSSVLEMKEGDKQIEQKLGVKLDYKYMTVQHHEDPLPGETPKKDKDYFEKKKDRENEEQKYTESAETLIQKLRDEKRVRKELKRQARRLKQEERQRRMEYKSQKRDQQEKMEIDKKRKELEENIQKIKDEREKAIKSMLENTRKINSNPLYIKLEKKQEYIEKSQLEERKRHLQSLRSLYMPIDHDSIVEHAKKMEELTKKKTDELKKKRLEDMIQSYDYSKYQTKFLDVVLEQEQAIKEERENKEEGRKNVQEKRDIYDKYVKEMHWPKVSMKKQKELEILKESMKTSPLKAKRSPQSIYGSEHPRADSISTGGPIIQNNHSDNEGEKGSLKRRKIIWPENTMAPKPKVIKEISAMDYLKERRMKHIQDKINGVAVSHKNNNDWKREFDKMDLHGKDKYDMYLGKAKDFEERAKRKQEIIGATKGATIEDIIDVNDMYVESIKAKLELLNDFN